MNWVEWLFWGTLDWRVASSSLLNAFAVGYQLYTLWRSRRSEGLSLVMMGIFLYMQVSFAQQAWVNGQQASLFGMAASAVFTLWIILYAVYLRRRKVSR